MRKRTLIICCSLLIVLVAVLSVTSFFLGKSKGVKIAVDFSYEETEEPETWTYPFMNFQLSDYICKLSTEVGVDPDLVVAILLTENESFNPNAMNRNDNGTIDVGMFQLNDRYLRTTFKNDYWFENIELDPFNWKHNTYIAVHHIKYLQDKLKVLDDVIMAYNGGVGAVMNGTVKPITISYLSKVKNELYLLKHLENCGI